MFLNQTTDTARMPVVLLSGFLGSGKTTLINAALEDLRLADTAVAVNEFGEIPLDHHLIDQGQDRTMILANGCLCCNLAGDMENAVMRIFSRREGGELPPFKRLLVEPSGLADPAPIAQAILRNPLMSRVLRLEAIITAVDAVFAERQLDRQEESRKQILLADRLVLTKTDRADTATIARLRSVLAALNPAAPVLEAVHGKVDPTALFPAGFLDPESADHALSAYAPTAGDHPGQHLDDTHAISLIADEPLAWRAFDAWLRAVRIAHGDRLLRLKGFLNVAETTGPLVIQGVHHVLDTPVELAGWPDSDRRTRIVVIAKGLVAGAIEADWNAALPGMRAAAAARAA
jgi:G3E family GTPase